MNTISFDINNQRTMKLTQRQHGGKTLIVIEDQAGNHESMNDREAFIDPSDFVMLINWYRYIKRNDIQDDFINPNGKADEKRRI